MSEGQTHHLWETAYVKGLEQRCEDLEALAERCEEWRHLVELAHDWRISDEFLGNVFRSKVGRNPTRNDGPEEARCEMCGERMFWIECPTGGWWKHVDHPADDHDGEAPVPEHSDGAGDG